VKKSEKTKRRKKFYERNKKINRPQTGYGFGGNAGNKQYRLG
jgi:hypothetical protein